MASVIETTSLSQVPIFDIEHRAFEEKQSRRAQIAASHAAERSISHPTTAPPPATSVLLQGNPRVPAAKTLFLFPDGSGSAASYTKLSRISEDTVVYGLNCPYLRNPSAWTGGLQDLTPLYLAEIRHRQPKGPYYLGGWSTGGIIAFDAAQALDREGEKVERLILIDSPCPIHLKRLPPRLMVFLKSIQIFGNSPTSWLYPHFEANTNALQKYQVRPFEAYHEPRTRIIWARRGVLEDYESRVEIRREDSKEMKWIMCKRGDFSAMGWEKLLDEEEIRIRVLEDVNHFSMMKGEGAKRLGEVICWAMDE